MAEILKERSVLREAEIAAGKKAAKARQEAIFAQIYGDLAAEGEKKSQREQEVLARQTEEHSNNTPKMRDPNAIYIDPNSVIKTIFNELHTEDETKREDRGQVSAVERVYTDDDVFLTIPDMNGRLQGNWHTVVFAYETPDEIVTVGRDKLAVAKGGSRLKVQMERLVEGGFAVEMIDRDEHPLTELRLCGRLQYGIHPDIEDKMGYLPDENTFIHPAAARLVEQSLSQLVTVIHDGRVIDMTYPEKRSRKIGF